ncbi:kinase-like domain-containing protein, partial [Mycena sp. CBHHK59/15]
MDNSGRFPVVFGMQTRNPSPLLTHSPSGYRIGRALGGGSFATSVLFLSSSLLLMDHQCFPRRQPSQQTCVAACKVLVSSHSTPTQHDWTAWKRESLIQSGLSHVNVIRFFSALRVLDHHEGLLQAGMYLLLEFAPSGDLFDKITPPSAAFSSPTAMGIGFPPYVADFYFMQLLGAMHYIHGRGVCHRDLKPENLLLGLHGQLKVGDFGFATVYEWEPGSTCRVFTRCGTSPYGLPWDSTDGSCPLFQRFVSSDVGASELWSRLGDALSTVSAFLRLDPLTRPTFGKASRLSWCLRPNCLQSASSRELAQALNQSLRDVGELGVAAPNLYGLSPRPNVLPESHLDSVVGQVGHALEDPHLGGGDVGRGSSHQCSHDVHEVDTLHDL